MSDTQMVVVMTCEARQIPSGTLIPLRASGVCSDYFYWGGVYKPVELFIWSDWKCALQVKE